MRYILVFVCLLISSCTQVVSKPKLIAEGQSHSYVLILREKAFQPHYLDAYFGVGNKFFVILQNNQYAKFKMDSGLQELQIKSKASPASNLSLELVSNSTTCVKIIPNSAKLGVYAIPWSGYFIPSFNLKYIACPDNELLNGFTFVPIS